MQLEFGKDSQETRTFGITVQIRDAQGNPTGRTKTFYHDHPDKLSDFYHRHRGKPKRKKKGKAAKSKDVDKILKDVAEYAENKQTKRDQRPL